MYEAGHPSSRQPGIEDPHLWQWTTSNYLKVGSISNLTTSAELPCLLAGMSVR
jgi:hypothetical protein